MGFYLENCKLSFWVTNLVKKICLPTCESGSQIFKTNFIFLVSVTTEEPFVNDQKRGKNNANNEKLAPRKLSNKENVPNGRAGRKLRGCES